MRPTSLPWSSFLRRDTVESLARRENGLACGPVRIELHDFAEAADFTRIKPKSFGLFEKPFVLAFFWLLLWLLACSA